MFRQIATIAFSLGSMPMAFGVLSLQNFQADKHHRFENDPAFIGESNDWSGVARASNGRWVTMISSTYFLSAFHAPPGDGNSVIFHEDNDAGGTTITRTVVTDSVTRIGTTDIVIGRLNSAPGPTIAIYGIASNTTDEAGFSSSVYSDKEAFVVGLNNTGSGTTQFRVGRNVLDGFHDAIEVGPTTSDSITFDDDSGTGASLGDDEAFLQGGDSGAPMFVTSGTDLVLVGTNWFITDGESPNFSGTSFIPNHLTEINSIVMAGGESLTLVSVPEPSSILLIGLGGISLLRRRR